MFYFVESCGPQGVAMTLSRRHTGGNCLQNVARKLSQGVYIKPALYSQVIDELWKTPAAAAVCIVGNPGLGKTAMAIQLHNDCLQVRSQLRPIIVGWLAFSSVCRPYNCSSIIYFVGWWRECCSAAQNRARHEVYECVIAG